MATYLTDSWTSLTGLASVAYGSPDRYAEVANQIRSGSVVSFLDSTQPSDVITDVITIEKVTAALQEEYDEGGEFAKYVDSGIKTVQELAVEIRSKILRSYDQISTYETTLSDAIEYASAGVPGLKSRLESLIPDLGLYSKMAANIASSKLDKVPGGTQITLSDNVDLDKDAKGVSLATGYLTPADYYDEVPYPGVSDTAFNLPNSIIESISQGYSGYATLQPLDDLLRKGLASIISVDDISDIRNTTRSIAGLGTIDTVRNLTGIGTMSAADQAMYDVDLASIVIEANGYTVYDPLRDSNGDFVDPADSGTENSDEYGGLPYSQRPKEPTF